MKPPAVIEKRILNEGRPRSSERRERRPARKESEGTIYGKDREEGEAFTVGQRGRRKRGEQKDTPPWVRSI
jgi:hypothetical protein